MLLVNIFDKIEHGFDAFGEFIKDNYNEPFFWIIMFVVLLVLALYVISELADK